jgi:hypothetical protein
MYINCRVVWGSSGKIVTKVYLFCPSLCNTWRNVELMKLNISDIYCYPWHLLLSLIFTVIPDIYSYPWYLLLSLTHNNFIQSLTTPAENLHEHLLDTGSIACPHSTLWFVNRAVTILTIYVIPYFLQLYSVFTLFRLLCFVLRKNSFFPSWLRFYTYALLGPNLDIWLLITYCQRYGDLIFVLHK